MGLRLFTFAALLFAIGATIDADAGDPPRAGLGGKSGTGPKAPAGPSDAVPAADDSMLFRFLASAQAAPALNLLQVKRFVELRRELSPDEVPTCDRRAAALALLADDCRIWFGSRTGPGTPWRMDGPWAAWDDFFHAERTYTDWSTSGDSVGVTVVETNEFHRLIEREAWPSRAVFWLDDVRKIRAYLLRPLHPGTAKDRLEEFRAWAAKHNPKELDHLMPRGTIDPEGDRPARWKAMLREWRASAGLRAID